jgi:hypothetical protein
METTLASPHAWAEAEFGGASLGDVRRGRRLVRMAAGLAERPSGTLPTAFDQRSELKAAYHFLACPDIRGEAIIQPHMERTRAACRQPGEYLLIEDTTILDFSSLKATGGLGRIGNDGGRGLYLHTDLAARVEGWNDQGPPRLTLMGIFGQQHWARQGTSRRKMGETDAQRLRHSRESERWAGVFHATGSPPDGCRWTYVADRESDIYEVFDVCGKQGVDFVVRAQHARALEGEDCALFDAVGRQPVLGEFQMELRARPTSPARTVTLVVRAMRVSIRGPWRPGGRVAELPLNVVDVRAIDQNPQDPPIHWVLLTSLPTDGFAAVVKIIRIYAARWLVEEYHKALKTGVRIEQSQLSQAHRIEALLAVLTVVAARLLDLKLLAATKADTPIVPDEVDPDAVRVLEALAGKPVNGWTYGALLVATARLGGFLARKGDGNPGWLTIWRGWRRLMDMVAGYSLALNRGPDSPGELNLPAGD